MIRTPEAFIPYLLALCAMLVGLLWNLSEAGPNATLTTGTATIGGPFALTDQNGRTRTSGDFRGHYMLVYFGYTHCPDVCPVTMSVMADALSKLGPEGNRIVPIFVTVDPERDTPKVMKAYVAAFGPRFVGLTGTARQIAQAAREYHVYYAKQPPSHGGYEMNHSSQIYLMDMNGRFIANYDETLGPGGLAKALRKAL